MLTVTGVDTLPEELREEVLVDLPLRVGDPFNRFIMQATADTITRRLRDRGYPSARVFTGFEVNREAETAKVSFDVTPGRKAVIGEVEVAGTTRIDPQLVRNLLIARPGRLYSQDELYQSQRNLYSSDLFRYANVNIDCAKFQPDGRLGAHPDPGQRGQAPARARRARLRHRRLLPRLRWAGPRATSSGAAAASST